MYSAREAASTSALDELGIRGRRDVLREIDFLALAYGSLQETDLGPVLRVLRHPTRPQFSPSNTVETSCRPSHTSLAERADRHGKDWLGIEGVQKCGDAQSEIAIGKHGPNATKQTER